MSREVIVNALDREIPIKKITLGRAADLAELIQDLRDFPKIFSSLDEYSNQKVLEHLPELINGSLAEVAKIIEFATGIDRKDVLELGFDELSDIVIAVLEVNDIERIIENIKKLMARKIFQETSKSVQQADREVKASLASTPGSFGQSTSSPVNTSGPNTTS